MYTFEELQEGWRRREEARKTGVTIYSTSSRSWRIAVVIGRSPDNRKQLRHGKTIRGTRNEAQVYAAWIKELAAAGQTVTNQTVSQSELKQLQELQANADRFREKLTASVRAGAKVEPGALKLPG